MAQLRTPAVATTSQIGGVILTLAILAVLVLGGGQAQASHVDCGDTITTDTTLDSDLIDCPNNGIFIGADDVTLDLNGHTIDGDGTQTAGCDPRTEFCDEGVSSLGHDRVTVMHGSVRGFDDGVAVGKTRHARLLGISSSNNRFAAILLGRSARSLVRNSSGSRSTARNGGDGMFLIASHHVRILDSSFRHNGEVGIHVADSTHDLIKGNTTSRNRLFGIILENSERNRVKRNRSVRDGAIGIYLAPGSGNVIARNRVSHPRRGEGTGIEVDGGDHNVIRRNSVRDTAGHGISVGFDVVVGNVVRRNHIHGAGKDGVHVDNKARHTHLWRNHAFGAKDDGLDADNATTRLSRNEARRNGDLGIEAVHGVIDGGGNKASGNGDPRQCTNIACS